jgi:glutaconate CoA-transferase, subunit A
MAEIVTLAEAVQELVRDGDTVALEGFTHLIPSAAGHELVRRGRRELTLIRLTPDVIYDQLIGMGCARKLVFSWGGNPGVGSLHRFRDAVEHGWPAPLELEEHSHAGMAAAYAAGAANLPFAVLRGYRGGDLPKHTRVATIECPFTGEELAAVPAHRPDVGIVHAQRADRRGNVQLWGILGVQKETVLASSRSIVTVEEIVDELDPRPGAIVLRAGSSTRSRSHRAARTRRMRTGTTSATTTSMSPGTRSAATATPSARGCSGTCSTPATSSTTAARCRRSPFEHVHAGRDDGRRSGAAARRRHRLLRGHRPSEPRRKPRATHARA